MWAITCSVDFKNCQCLYLCLTMSICEDNEATTPTSYTTGLNAYYSIFGKWNHKVQLALLNEFACDME
jgi:hypothetical protein